MAINGSSLFSIIKPDFFGLLSGKNKQVNFLLLVETSEAFGTNLTLERKKLASILADYIAIMHFEEVGDEGESYNEDDIDVSSQTPATKANTFLRSLERRGWLDLDQDEDLNPIVSRTDAFIAIYDALSNLIAEETNTKEYATPLWNLYQNIINFDFKNATVSMQAVESSSNELSKALLSINSRIKRFVNKAMANSNIGEKEILQKLTIEYQRLTAYIAFHNLLTRNNPNKYINVILDKLYSFSDPDLLNQMTKDYLDTKQLKEDDSNWDLALSYFRNVINAVEEQMNNLESSLDVIAGRNRAYVKNSSDRIRFRLNNERDIKGEINSLLKKIKATNYELEDDISEVFKLYSFGQVDNKSMYTARALSRIAPKKLPFIKHEIDPEAMRRAEELVKQQNLYSIEAVNKFISAAMEGKTKCLASEIQVHDIEQLIKMLLVPVYSSNSDAIYIVKKLEGQMYTVMGFESQQYEIRIKEGVR